MRYSLATLCFLSACTPQSVAFLGDSITKGERPGVSQGDTFVALTRAQTGADVINQGTPGETTRGALTHLDYIVAQRPSVAVVMYGTNDAFIENGAPRVPLTEYRENLYTIVATLKSAGIRPVLMTSPRWESETENESLVLYAQTARDVARDTQTTLVDNFARWGAPHAARWTTDNCHPNPAGHRAIADSLRGAL